MTRQLISLIIIFITILSAECQKKSRPNKLLTLETENETEGQLLFESTNTPSQYVDLLGAAAPFALIGGSTTTGAGGMTTVNGSVGSFPGTSITGLINIVNGSVHAGDPVSQQAQVDIKYAYDTIKDKCGAQDMSGQELGGLTLVPGTYKFLSSCALTSGTLTLNGEGNADAKWYFQIGSTLITGPYSNVVMTNSGSPFNVYWQVGSSATIATQTNMCGNIIAYASITMNTSARLNGRALARVGAVTLMSNNITN